MEISQEKYDALMNKAAHVDELENKVSHLEEETKNKSIALEEARKKAKEKQDDLSNQLKEKETELKSIHEKLELSEEENIDEKIKSIKEGNSKYSEILKKQGETRKQNIAEYEKFLGEEFMKEKANFFEGLSDEKKELLLKDYAENKGFGKDENQDKPKIGIHNNGEATSGKTSDFDKKVSLGASSEELINSLDF